MRDGSEKSARAAKVVVATNLAATRGAAKSVVIAAIVTGDVKTKRNR